MVYRDTVTEGLAVHVLPELLWYTGILCTHSALTGTNTRGNCDIWYISWPSSVSVELHVK